jgi:hypothetical protein
VGALDIGIGHGVINEGVGYRTASTWGASQFLTKQFQVGLVCYVYRAPRKISLAKP